MLVAVWILNAKCIRWFEKFEERCVTKINHLVRF